MVAISYSVGGEYLHHILADYKRAGGPQAEAAAEQVETMLSLFLARHEQCVARAAGTAGFDLVTTVPSSDPQRDRRHPLRRIVSSIQETSDRHERLLARTSQPVVARRFSDHRYRTVRPLSGEHVLLIDDTWTTGASVQSAAAALKTAGAGTVSAVVIGRHLNRGWYENDKHLETLQFDWSRCALCAERVPGDERLPGAHPLPGAGRPETPAACGAVLAQAA
jgi:hypothetical protein